MSYTYTGALARKRAIDATWQAVDLSLADVNDIYSTYQKAYLTLTNPLYSHPVYLDMDLVRAQIPVQIPGPTVTAWLASLGTGSLPTFNSAPSFKRQTVLFRDAWQAGYSIEPASTTAAPGSQLPVGALNDLFISQAGIDFTYMYQHALVSVNGYLHSTGTAQNGLFVKGGQATGRKLNDSQVGILSFEQLGAIRQVPITDTMIYNQRGVEPYSHFVYVNLGQSLTDKSLLFVLGGHLHCMDESYSVIGDGLVRINMDRIPWSEIFFDAMAGLDISSITWGSTKNNPSQISVDDLYSDAVIGAFLKLTQSFFVVVDTPSLYLIRHFTEKTKLPGRWTCAKGNQIYPLIGPMGKVIEYTPVWENTLFVLRGTTVYDQHYLYETGPWKTTKSVAPSLYPGQPISYPRAFLMELGYEQLG